MDPATFWEKIYRENAPEEVSWFQAEAHLSRALIGRVAPNGDAAIVDVGAGASTLVDALLSDNYRHITVFDLSATALERARSRLGATASRVCWLAADVLSLPLAAGSVDVWHDRAVFHFLTDPVDRARYVAQVRRTVRARGHVLVTTFAEDGPTRCSGLAVSRYSPATLHGEFGHDFHLLESHRELHHTPRGTLQSFTCCVCRYEPSTRDRPRPDKST